jgi:hypothetical protein
MPSQPLSHHEIVGLIEPFSRAGYRADLGTSQRLDRRLAFQATRRTLSPPGPDADAIGVSDTLVLESRAGGRYRLARELTPDDGPVARLWADGPDPGELLSRVEAIDPATLFDVGSGYRIAYRASTSDGPGGYSLDEVAIHVGPWRMTVEADPVRGMAADVELACDPASSPVTLPEDLFAVLGRAWGLVRPAARGWTTTVRLRGRPPTRDASTRALVRAAAAHLAHTFQAAPDAFHERHQRERWRVTLRRMLPLAASVLLIAIGAACTRLDISNDATLRVLLMSSPPVLMILFFSLREVPRIEFPPLPRVSNAGRWPPLAASMTTAETS